MITDDDPFWSLHNFKLNTLVTEAENTLPSTYLKAWLYRFDFKNALSRTISVRLNFTDEPWKYDKDDQTKEASALTTKLTYKMWTSVGEHTTQQMIDREWEMSVIDHNIKKIIASDKSSSAWTQHLYGGMISIRVPTSTMIPESNIAFYVANSMVTNERTVPFGNASLLPNNADIYVAVQMTGDKDSDLKSKIEIGSYKPEDFDAYSPDYCLYTIDNARIVGDSTQDSVDDSIFPY